jgi:glucans biosynthesis protein C
MYLQSSFMGLLFFVAGVFVPPSIDRAFRLGLPVSLYMFVLGSVTEYYISHSWTAPYSFAHEWVHHITDLEVLQGLIFSAGNAALLAFALIIAAGRFLIRGLFPDRRLLAVHPAVCRWHRCAQE